MSGELLSFPARWPGHVLGCPGPRETASRRRPGPSDHLQEGDTVRTTGGLPGTAGRRSSAHPRPLGQRSTAGPSRRRHHAAGADRPGCSPSGCHAPMQTASRRSTRCSRSAGPARADHRDRQTGKTRSPSTPSSTRRWRRHLHLRRHRPARATWPRSRDPPAVRRHGVHDHRRRHRGRRRRLQYIAPYAGCAMASGSCRRAARAHRLRRPQQAADAYASSPSCCAGHPRARRTR